MSLRIWATCSPPKAWTASPDLPKADTQTPRRQARVQQAEQHRLVVRLQIHEDLRDVRRGKTAEEFPQPVKIALADEFRQFGHEKISNHAAVNEIVRLCANKSRRDTRTGPPDLIRSNATFLSLLASRKNCCVPVFVMVKVKLVPAMPGRFVTDAPTRRRQRIGRLQSQPTALVVHKSTACSGSTV